ncbi:MAG: hypothetical protein R3B99_28830 [Polyangiales bacterium]
MLFALPTGRAAARLIAGIRGRLGFGRNLAAFSMQGAADDLRSGAAAGVTPGPRGVVIGGGLDGPAGLLLAALERGERSVRL